MAVCDLKGISLRSEQSESILDLISLVFIRQYNLQSLNIATLVFPNRKRRRGTFLVLRTL
jgi:hypothetical protein